jgi:hypothetical protein
MIQATCKITAIEAPETPVSGVFIFGWIVELRKNSVPANSAAAKAGIYSGHLRHD